MMNKGRITINLIIPHYTNMFSSFYTLEIIKEVSQAAIAAGVDLLIATSWRPDPASGVLFADVMGNENAIRQTRVKKIPYLILNYYAPRSRENCIGIDNRKAAAEAADYLIRAGHKRIAIITGKLNAQAGILRLEGFKDALGEAGLKLDKSFIVSGDWSKESGRRAAEKLLSLKKLPTAVFSSGDEMALGAMEAVTIAGLKIPGDISFVGFDNIPQSQIPKVPLTTVEQPFEDLAAQGVKLLVEIIKKKQKQPVRILLDNTKLIKRASVADLSEK